MTSSAVPPLPQPPIAEEALPTREAPEPMAQLPQTGHRLPEGERKAVTVLSAGVKGIPALAQALDPEVFPAVHRQLFDLMYREVQRVGGRVNLVTGDGLRAIFGAPIAHEDHAVRALHAALGLRGAFASFAADLRRTWGIILTM
jgi:class 3 adenylate cyclase